MGTCSYCNKDRLDQQEYHIRHSSAMELTLELDKISGLLQLEQDLDIPDEERQEDILCYSLDMKLGGESRVLCEGVLFILNADRTESRWGVMDDEQLSLYDSKFSFANFEAPVQVFVVCDIQSIRTFKKKDLFFFDLKLFKRFASPQISKPRGDQSARGSDASKDLLFVKDRNEWIKWVSQFKDNCLIPVINEINQDKFSYIESNFSYL